MDGNIRRACQLDAAPKSYGHLIGRLAAALVVLQFPFGLVPEFIVPSSRPVVLLPDFVGAFSDLIF